MMGRKGCNNRHMCDWLDWSCFTPVGLTFECHLMLKSRTLYYTRRGLDLVASLKKHDYIYIYIGNITTKNLHFSTFSLLLFSKSLHKFLTKLIIFIIFLFSTLIKDPYSQCMSLSRHHKARTWVIGSTSLEIAVMERQYLVSLTYLRLIFVVGFCNVQFQIKHITLSVMPFLTFCYDRVANYNMV